MVTPLYIAHSSWTSYKKVTHYKSHTVHGPLTRRLLTIHRVRVKYFSGEKNDGSVDVNKHFIKFIIALHMCASYLEIPSSISIMIMVFIFDGCSFDYAHTWSKSGISIC